MSTRQSMYSLTSYVWYDTFCQMYFNRKTKQWQRGWSDSCLFNSKREAEEDRDYFYDGGDITLKPIHPFALAA